MPILERYWQPGKRKSTDTGGCHFAFGNMPKWLKARLSLKSLISQKGFGLHFSAVESLPQRCCAGFIPGFLFGKEKYFSRPHTT